MPFAIDRDFVLDTARALVRIDSVNPSLVPGAPGEAEVARHVARSMVDLGLAVSEHEPVPGRVSVVGRRAGAGGGRSLMLNAHHDTVGVAGMAAPFSAEVRDGRLYGRGAYDMKGSLASCLGAVKALDDAGVVLAGDLLVAAVADEEHASLGTADLISRHPVDGAIVTEPTQLAICRAHKGFVWLRVTTHGRAAHGSQPTLGRDANLHMGRVLAALEGLSAELGTRAHALVGAPSVHAATLQGGTGLSTYAAQSVLEIERRTIPGETEEHVVAEVQAILDCLAAADPTFRASLEVLLVRAPFEVAADAPIVAAVEAASAAVLPSVPAHVGENPWMDAALLAQAGVDTVVLGPRGTGAHADEEWVDVDSLVTLAALLAEAACRYCGTGSTA